MEPKSGKLHKLGHGLFGPKWTEKWVHLDGNVLKYFPMATDQPVFSLSSSRQSAAISLTDYAFGLADEKKLNRKFSFQFVSKEKVPGLIERKAEKTKLSCL
uniref:PH domain-containing protein n=1 Tax=Globisporangium ultimum (strain ATCC 200006 / CBS 805.95 / DAOM BR144) TaxID=431595 RepID=K3WMR4_GLOUD